MGASRLKYGPVLIVITSCLTAIHTVSESSDVAYAPSSHSAAQSEPSASSLGSARRRSSEQPDSSSSLVKTNEEMEVARFERQGSEAFSMLTVKKAQIERAKLELASYEQELATLRQKTADTKAQVDEAKSSTPRQVNDREYPSSFAVEPKSIPAESFNITAIETASIYCLCEFHCDDDAGARVPLWHPVGQAKSAPTSELIAKLGPSIKAVYNNMRTSSTPRTVAGVAVPDLSAFIPQDASLLPGDDYDTHVDVPEGNALALAQSLFGEARDGRVGQLEKATVASSGPFGAAGTVMWVCAEHAALVKDWNEEEVGKKGATKRAGKLITAWSVDSVC